MRYKPPENPEKLSLSLTVTNRPAPTKAAGRQFLVELTGDKRPLLQFYDLTYQGKIPEWLQGQPVSRYYAETVADHPPGAGLDLMGYVAEWKVDAYAMTRIIDWLRLELEVKRGYKLV